MVMGIGVSLVVFLLIPVFPNVYAWFPLRFIIGAAGALQKLADEVWVNQIAGERTRGRVVDRRGTGADLRGARGRRFHERTILDPHVGGRAGVVRVASVADPNCPDLLRDPVDPAGGAVDVTLCRA